jgi:hypothetical protein
MDERQPPKMAHEAPGLVWRTRKKTEWAATWQARTDLVAKGYSPKSVTLWSGKEPTLIEAAHIATQCQQFQTEMLMWSRGVELPVHALKDTLRSLILCYRTDKDSPYQKNRFHVRQSRDSMLRRIGVRYGDELLSDIKWRTLLGWHREWSQDGKHAPSGLQFVGQLRALFSFGSLLENPDCERLSGVMHKMRFTGTEARGKKVTAEYAVLIRAAAREHFGWPSLALAQAFQFECTLRQKDVIGEMVPLSEPGISEVIVRGQKWLRGIVWQEIDENLILRHVTSKKQKLITVDLRLAPMVIEELALMAGVSPADLTRDMLPVSGPIVICDTNGLPWTGNEYRRKWRKVARHCGIPDDVWNMDTRSGAISEADMAGAPGEWVQQAATHSSIEQTRDYTRNQAEATAKVMKLRVEGRNRPKTDD